MCIHTREMQKHALFISIQCTQCTLRGRTDLNEIHFHFLNLASSHFDLPRRTNMGGRINKNFLAATKADQGVSLMGVHGMLKGESKFW
jgi:hypothetical protein